jgi:putative acetyltransferase
MNAQPKKDSSDSWFKMKYHPKFRAFRLFRGQKMKLFFNLVNHVNPVKKMNMNLREYHEADLNGVMAAWEAASAQAHPFLPPEFVDEVREAIPTLYIPNAETWVAELEGNVVGFISLLGNEVGALFVEPEQQGKSFGLQLMNKALDLKGELEVEVFSLNSIGCDFYRKYGFVTMEEKIHDQTGFGLIRMKKASTR